LRYAGLPLAGEPCSPSDRIRWRDPNPQRGFATPSRRFPTDGNHAGQILENG
jgi:hypothetical protein